MNTSTVHLTDDQFADYLMGLPLEPAANGHLAACVQCQAEVGGFEGSVAGLGKAAMAWSQAQPLPNLRPLVSCAPARQSGWFFTPARLSFAMALLFAVGTGVVLEHRHVAPVHDTATATATPASAAPTAAQLAADNQLLQSVDMALADNAPSPFREYNLQDAAAPGKSSNSRGVLRR